MERKDTANSVDVVIQTGGGGQRSVVHGERIVSVPAGPVVNINTGQARMRVVTDSIVGGLEL